MIGCRINQNKSICNCTYEPCPRKGICCECLNYHKKQGELPACYFTQEAESEYDRSVERYIEMKKEK